VGHSVHHNAGDGQTRTFNAGWWRCSRPCRPATSLSAPLSWQHTGTMDGARCHVAARCRIRTTYSWEGVHNVRKSTPKSFATLDASQLTALAQDAPVEWGTSADRPLMTKRTRISPLTMRKLRHVPWDFYPHCQAGRLQVRRIDGHRTLAVASTRASYQGCSTWHQSSVLSAGLYQNTTTSYFEPGNINRCIHVWRMDHNRRRPRYTDDGRGDQHSTRTAS
jgi:hypothetical protein